MRLLSLATLYPAPGRAGFGRFVRTQMDTLARREEGIAVTVVNPVGLPPLPDALLPARYRPLAAIPAVERDGPVTVHHPRFPLLPGLSGRFNPELIARAVLPLVRRLHAQAPFDLVDAQFFYPDGPAAARIARALGLPLAIKARGSDIHYWGTRPAALAQMRDAGARAGAMLAVSGALAADMAALGFPAERITVHHTGLDHARFFPRPRDAARAALDLPADRRIVACVGALIAIKGQALAIDALARLPDDIMLVLAGTGPDEAALRTQVTRLGLDDRVRFAGALGHDAMPLLLSAAQAMALPSEREGLANAWIEALACGAPLVIPDVGGARDVVTAPAAGRVVPRTAEAIAQGLQQVLAADVPQAEVAACVAGFSWAANAAALAAIYRDLIR